jgi:hypothetical protein
MKTFINFLLSVFSPLAAVPTGWAIYAGVTEQPAFPMNPIAAGVGAVAIIATSIAAGLLVTDIYAYNQSMKNKTERAELTMPVWSAWAVLLGCVVSEVALSLLIVVIPGALKFGVLVFPLMTAAGVFAFAVRFNLQQREVNRTQLRAEKRATTSNDKSNPRKVARNQKKVTRQPITDDALLTFFAATPGATDTQAAQHFGISRQAIGKRREKLYEVKQ